MSDELSQETPAEGEGVPSFENSEGAEEPRKLREIPASTVIHLLGLPSYDEISLLESKLDVLSGKVAVLVSRAERLASQMQDVAKDSYFERVDFQLAELRNLFKRIAPQLFSAVASQESAQTAKQDSASPLPNEAQQEVQAAASATTETESDQ